MVEIRPAFLTDNEAYNHYMIITRRLAAKGVVNISAVDLTALLILISMTKEKQDKFMAHQKLKEELRAQRLDHPDLETKTQAEERNHTLMDKVALFINSND